MYGSKTFFAQTCARFSVLLFFLKVGPFDEKRCTKRSYHFFTEYHMIFIGRLSWILDNHMNFQYQFGIPGIPGMDSGPMAKPDKVVLEVEILGRRSISISSGSNRWVPAGWEIFELKERFNGKINELNGECPLPCYCVWLPEGTPKIDRMD